jgi:hypothetical protein
VSSRNQNKAIANQLPSGLVKLRKVLGTLNPADLLAKDN